MNSISSTARPRSIDSGFTESKEVFQVEEIVIPRQIKTSRFQKFGYYACSIFSCGLVPLVRYGLSVLIKNLVLPAPLMNTAGRKAYNLQQKNQFIKLYPSCQEFDLKTADGAVINGMAIFQDGKSREVFKEKKAEDQKWIIRFNGNAEFYESGLFYSQEYAKAVGANILVFNYRGVGGSKGNLETPEQLILDGEACVHYLLSKGVKEENILIHGLSLGGAVGMQVASLHERIAVINERSFSSLSKEAAAISGLSIAQKLFIALGWELDSMAAFEKIKAKKLIVFHKQDAVMPYYLSSLYKVLKEKIKAQKPSAVSISMHKGQLKKRLKKEEKPLSVKLQRKFNDVNSEAHCYLLHRDKGYLSIIAFAKDFFIR